jgi:hypothetical protein
LLWTIGGKSRKFISAVPSRLGRTGLEVNEPFRGDVSIRWASSGGLCGCDETVSLRFASELEPDCFLECCLTVVEGFFKGGLGGGAGRWNALYLSFCLPNTLSLPRIVEADEEEEPRIEASPCDPTFEASSSVPIRTISGLLRVGLG